MSTDVSIGVRRVRDDGELINGSNGGGGGGVDGGVHVSVGVGVGVNGACETTVN